MVSEEADRHMIRRAGTQQSLRRMCQGQTAMPPGLSLCPRVSLLLSAPPALMAASALRMEIMAASPPEFLLPTMVPFLSHSLRVLRERLRGLA